MNVADPPHHDYLGDGVYVHTESDGSIVLKANHHEFPTDTIVLEPRVYEALVKYRENTLLLQVMQACDAVNANCG